MNNKYKKSLLLIDGHAHLYRTYYSLPCLTNKQGELCNVIFGVINQIKKLYLQYKPSQMIVIFDSSVPNFRNKLFSKYKINRSPMPEDLKKQIKPLLKILKNSGIPVIIKEKVEADDVIGSLTTLAIKNNYSIVLISTNDKDMYQLIRSNVFIINSTTDSILGLKEIERKYNLKPQLFTLFLALKGDKSDNIPGVPGIGDKTAIKLIQEFESLEKIYNNLNIIERCTFRNAKKIAKNLKLNKKIAFLSLQLVTIRIDLKFNLNSKSLQLSQPNFENLTNIFNYYQFNQWNKELNKNKWFLLNIQNRNNNLLNSSIFYEKKTILNKIIFFKWIKKMEDANIFSFFIETDNTNAYKANVLSISLSIDKNKSIYLPFLHQQETNEDVIDFTEIMLHLKPFFENTLKVKIVQNLKLNIILLKKYDIKLLGKTFDVVLEQYILLSYLHTKNTEILINNPEILSIQKKNKNTFSNQKFILNQHQLLIEKSQNIFKLHLKMFKILEKEKKTKHILETIDIPLVKVILNIENNGVLIDQEKLKNYSKLINLKLLKLEKKAHRIAEETFNISSNKQSQLILFKKMGLKTSKKTKNGNYSTNEKVLLSLSHLNPLPLVILKYRKLNKLKTTYIDKLLKIQNINTGRVYTSYSQISTSTGRLSSIQPNLQNIPTRTLEGRYIRTTFIAPKGYSIVSADYSQIELRIIAHLSKDQVLLNSFKNNNDVHCLTAVDLFDIPINSITKEQRQLAKTINFSLIYGMSAFGLSEKLQISIKQSQEYIDKYFNLYHGVFNYIHNIRQIAYRDGFVTTLIGRKLYIPNIYSKNKYVRKAAERMSINAPLQGSAADIIKIAMININHFIEKNNIKNFIKMIMQVHDELIFEIKTDKVQTLSKTIQNLMETSVILDLPLKVEIGKGENWEQAH